MELSIASKIANDVRAVRSPYCSKIEIAGSIRRRKQFVHDVDLVCIPSNQGQFIAALQSLGKIQMGGAKLIRCQLPGAMLDVYIANSETWATLLLIRTGSKEHNIRLCSLARKQGMTLKADGTGLFSHAPNQTEYEQTPDARIAGDTEHSIFEALGIPYKKPEDRN